MTSKPAKPAVPGKRLRVLISGAGIGGPVVAYWLARANVADITVVERDPELRTTGQSVDLRGEAIKVVKAMGLIETVRAHTTAEAGMQHVDAKGKIHAKFDAAPPGSDEQSFTSEFEIFRGELAEIFYQATKDDATYIFGDYIKSIAQSEEYVTVTFAKGEPKDFDLVVGADGIGSALRGMAFNVPSREYVHPMGGWTSYFTVKKDYLKGSKYAHWYNIPGSRMVLLRPDPNDYTRANLGQIVRSDGTFMEKFHRAQGEGPAALKKIVRECFADAEWITPQILDGMDEADDFYIQEVAQVRMPSLHKGRVAFVGDAGSCPSPLSGMGTTVAIVEAYLLAGEIMRHSTDIPKALQSYNDICQPFIKEAQDIPAGMMKLMSPKTKVGIWLVQSVFSFATRTRLDKAMFSLMAGAMTKREKDIAPKYEWPKKEVAEKVNGA